MQIVQGQAADASHAVGNQDAANLALHTGAGRKDGAVSIKSKIELQHAKIDGLIEYVKEAKQTGEHLDEAVAALEQAVMEMKNLRNLRPAAFSGLMPN